MAHCPSIAELAAAVESGLDSSPFGEHVEHCHRCAARASRIREDNELLSELDALLEGGESVLTSDLAPGESIPGFRIVQEIHRGGQGVVYEAIHESSGDRVALKLLRQGGFATTRQRHRFDQEIEIISQMHHPNIVAVRGSRSMLGGRPGYVMEFIEGETLDDWSERYRGDRKERDDPAHEVRALRLFLKICDAVMYAHMCGVIHRDLKPANILVDEHDEPQVLDFGIAKAVGSTTGPQTLEGEFKGTFAYASPEQVRCEPKLLDVRIDVYALGLILFEMLTGELPFDTKVSTESLVETISAGRLENPSRFTPWIHRDLEAVIMKAVATAPEDRYQSVEALRSDVQNHVDGGPVLAQSGGAMSRLRRMLGFVK